MLLVLAIVVNGMLGVASGTTAAPVEVLGNKGVALRLFDEISKGDDSEATEALFSSHAVIRTPVGQHHGLAGVGEFISMLRTEYPSGTFAIRQTIVSGDTVVVHWTLDGIGRSDGQAPMLFSNGASVDGIALVRVENYLIVELHMR